MPAYVLDALFVLTGLLFLLLLPPLLERVRARPLRLLMNAAAGLCALLTANALGGLFGVRLGVNAATCAVSALLGVPGVGLLFGLRFLIFSA